jgi:membrane-associated phospholipid phosphatase
MDQTWFLFLNGLPARLPALGTIAVAVATHGIVSYVAVLIWLWWRGTPSDARRRTLLLSVLAGTLSLVANVGLNLAAPRPRPFLVLPAQVLLRAPHDPSFPSDHAAFTSAIAITWLLAGMRGWGLAGAGPRPANRPAPSPGLSSAADGSAPATGTAGRAPFRPSAKGVE